MLKGTLLQRHNDEEFRGYNHTVTAHTFVPEVPPLETGKNTFYWQPLFEQSENAPILIKGCHVEWFAGKDYGGLYKLQEAGLGQIRFVFGILENINQDAKTQFPFPNASEVFTHMSSRSLLREHPPHYSFSATLMGSVATIETLWNHEKSASPHNSAPLLWNQHVGCSWKTSFDMGLLFSVGRDFFFFSGLEWLPIGWLVYALYIPFPALFLLMLLWSEAAGAPWKVMVLKLSCASTSSSVYLHVNYQLDQLFPNCGITGHRGTLTGVPHDLFTLTYQAKIVKNLIRSYIILAWEEESGWCPSECEECPGCGKFGNPWAWLGRGGLICWDDLHIHYN